MQHRNTLTIVIVTDTEIAGDAAYLCALLCDEHIRRTQNGCATIVVRVAAEDPNIFLQSKGSYDTPCTWRCHEKETRGDRWVTYLGTPDTVVPLERLDQAILGTNTHDDGGAADCLIVCGHSIQVLQQVALSISSVESDPLFTSSLKDPLVLTCTGQLRQFDWWLRRLSWPLSQPIAVCAFSAPLWYARRVLNQKGVVLSVPSHFQSIFVMRHYSHSKCQQVWRTILESSRQHTSRKITVMKSTVDPTEQKLVASTVGAKMLFYQLQDASLVLFPCLVVVVSQARASQQTQQVPLSVGSVGRLVLSMVVELYRLHQHLAANFPILRDCMLQEDTILQDLVDNRLLVALTNNTGIEILERVSQGSKNPIRHAFALESFIHRKALREWRSATFLSPFPQDASHNNKKQQDLLVVKFAKEALDGGLLLLLSLGQLLGLQIQTELVTTSKVVQRLQSVIGKSYVQVSVDGCVKWNDNQLMSTNCLKAFGIASLRSLVAELSKNPMEGHTGRWVWLVSKL